MSAFRGGRQSAGKYTDRPLIKLVEDYLLENNHLYFVNLEDMGEVIRRKSFKYARMKQSVFKEQLRRAYRLYSDTKTKVQEEFSGNDIEMDDTPLTDDVLKQMEGDPSDSDSDLVIDEAVQAKDAGANQMKNLYMAAADPISNNNPTTDKNEILNDVTAPVQNTSLNLLSHSQKTNQIDCVSVGSSTSSKSKKKSSDVTDARKLDDCNESESDLEIIEEVSNANYTTHQGSVIMSVNGNQRPTIDDQSSYIGSPSPVFGSFIRIGPSKTVAPTTKTPVSNTRGTPTRPENFVEQNKGSKRKLNHSNDTGTGINEDLTRKRPKKEVNVVHDTGYKLRDFAGSEKVVEDICKLLMHLKHPEIYQTLGVTPPRGFLLHGPPGTGKTLLANAIAGELEIPMLKIAGTELVSGISGESESNIRDLFNQAVAAAPCIVFIDEIDSVTPKRENVSKEMERRIVAQLLACIDDLGSKEKGDQVLLIGATNRVEAIDTALRRAGRFDREICLGIPDEKSREKILSVICCDLRLESGFKISALARLTPGYVGADLKALVREAAVQAVNRKILSEKLRPREIVHQEDDEMADTQQVVNCHFVSGSNETESPQIADATNAEEVVNNFQSKEPVTSDDESLRNQTHGSPLTWIKETSPLSNEELQDLFVTMNDFEFALKHVQPSSKREGFATVPDTTWNDIGALQDIRDELQVSILGPVKHAEAFQKLGLTTPAGVLLCGPPGCGKTLLAKAVANEAGINFISVKGPELLNMYVGESERAVRQCFLRARNSSPCVIFFDELDALCPRRSDAADGGSGGRVVNQLLTEMDGIESRQGVFVMAATNRPDIIDPAILRPGRLDKILFVNLPTSKDRWEILKALTKNSSRPTLHDDVDLEEIASCPECADYTGADLSALIREASIAAFRELVLHNEGEVTKDLKVYRRHFTVAFAKTKPSVGKDDRLKYNKMAEKFSSIR